MCAITLKFVFIMTLFGCILAAPTPDDDAPVKAEGRTLGHLRGRLGISIRLNRGIYGGLGGGYGYGYGYQRPGGFNGYYGYLGGYGGYGGYYC